MRHFYLILWIMLIVSKAFGSAREVKNINDFGVFPIRKQNETDLMKKDRYENIKSAFEFCIKNGCNLFFPKGIYDVGARNFPFRNDLNSRTLLDCKGIKIIGSGDETIFMTSSSTGADVLQLNKVKNISFEKLAITAVLTNKNKSGSNGISITNGFDNIYLNDILIYNLPGVDVGGGIDGSKGLTIQAQTGVTLKMGKLFAQKIRVVNCAYGFRLDTNYLDDILSQRNTLDLDINLSAKTCYQGVSIAFGKARKTVPSNAKLNIRMNVDLKDCQQYVRFSRVFGGTYSIFMEKSPTYRANNWARDDKLSFGFLSNYSKNVNLNLKGNVGKVDKKIIIGAVGSIVEPFSISNSTDNSNFYFNIDGQANSEFEIIEYQGKSMLGNSIELGPKIKLNNQTRNKVNRQNKIYNK